MTEKTVNPVNVRKGDDTEDRKADEAENAEQTWIAAKDATGTVVRIRTEDYPEWEKARDDNR